MRGFATGLVLGLVFGTAFSALTVTFGAPKAGGGEVSAWFRGAKLMDESSLLRLGYAAGAHDMLAEIVKGLESAERTDKESKDRGQIHPEIFTGAEIVRLWTGKRLDCMNEHTGGGLGQFVEWASRFWIGSESQAASALLVGACK